MSTVDGGKRNPAEVDYDATVEGVMDALLPLGFEPHLVDATGGEPCCSLDLGDGRCLDVTVKLAMTCGCCSLDGHHYHDHCEHPCCPDYDIEAKATAGSLTEIEAHDARYGQG